MIERTVKNRFSSRIFYLVFSLLILSSCSSDEGVEPIDPIVENPENPIPEGDKLPLFSIDTKGATIVNEPKIDAEAIMTSEGIVDFEGKIAIEFRGSSSQGFPKKSYGFETRDASNMDLDVSILGMPEEEDWILHGPFSDKSLMRNVLIYDLSREMNQYASRSKFVELNINGAYQGVYVFMEKLKRDDQRIAIATLKETDISGEELTGGYIIKVDRSDSGDFNDQNSFSSLYGSSLNISLTSPIYFVYEYPDEEEIRPEQRDYISTYVGDFEAALASDDFTDPDAGYQTFIDSDSFVDFFILNELSNNVDGYRLSTFMHKDKNGKLKMGPIWDFNLGFGNADYCAGGETNVWAYKFNERCLGDSFQVPFWWERLMQDPAYVAHLQTRWNQLRASTLSEAYIHAKVDAYVDALDRTGASKANFETWPVFGIYVWPNNFVGQNYSEETNYLKSWISDRLVWLDGAIEGL